jgi:hypothetical protein
MPSERRQVRGAAAVRSGKMRALGRQEAASGDDGYLFPDEAHFESARQPLLVPPLRVTYVTSVTYVLVPPCASPHILHQAAHILHQAHLLHEGGTEYSSPCGQLHEPPDNNSSSSSSSSSTTPGH